jgi:hypothetical protein
MQNTRDYEEIASIARFCVCAFLGLAVGCVGAPIPEDNARMLVEYAGAQRELHSAAPMTVSAVCLDGMNDADCAALVVDVTAAVAWWRAHVEPFAPDDLPGGPLVLLAANDPEAQITVGMRSMDRWGSARADWTMSYPDWTPTTTTCTTFITPTIAVSNQGVYVAAHELGHCFGLLDDPQDLASIMAQSALSDEHTPVTDGDLALLLDDWL